MNKVVLIGRLTKDVELRTTQSGKSVATFTIAVNRPFSKYEADFINIQAWGKTAENCNSFIHKGSKVAIEGRLQISSYDKDGVKKYVTEIVANEVEFLDSKGATFGNPVGDTENIPF